VFIDEYSINPVQRAKTFTALQTMLDKTLVEGDEVAITRWIRRPDVVLSFTRDRSKVREILTKLRGDGVMGLSFLAHRREVARSVEQAARNGATTGNRLALDAAIAEVVDYREELSSNLRNLAADLSASMAAMGSLNGRKILIFVGDNLPLNPGVEMYEVVERAFRLSRGSLGSVTSDAIEQTENFSIELISRVANANGVTFYSLSSGLKVTSDDGAIFATDLNLGTVPFTTYANSADSFKFVAKATGGATSTDPSTLDRVLAQLSSDLQSYYSIGYKPGVEGKRARSIRVEVNIPGAEIRTRKSLVVRTAEEDLASRALSCLAQNLCESDFSFTVKLGTPKRVARNRYVVMLELIIPMRSLTLVHTNDRALAGFSVHIAAVNDKGELSEGTLRGQRVTVLPEELGSAPQRELRWGIELEGKKGATKLVVAVADEVSMLTGLERAELIVSR
jgi:VWFA-related protein